MGPVVNGKISREVSDAIHSGAPVVALESINLCDGLTAEGAIQLFEGLEAAVREAGATPATIAIIDGVPCIGLDASALQSLVRRDDVRKCSTRDLPLVCATGGTGATTVASTCYLARAFGIDVVASEGIGGIHRGFQDTLDISADLAQLSRTPVTVVASGIKAFLNVGATLEALESLNVLVVGYDCEVLPGFYSRTSPFRLEYAIREPAAAAAIARQRDRMALTSALLVCNPVPVEAAIPEPELESWIQQAMREAAHHGVGGKAITPFILAHIREVSGGRSETAGRALAESNASLAARISRAIREEG
jgi:pseudouridylate synthase